MAEDNNETARLRIGEAYIKGEGVTPDLGKGLELLEEIADGGNALALRLLGDLYSYPGPVPSDGAKAVAYYERAIAAGQRSALVRLGDLYRDGSVVQKDPAKALAFYQQAMAEDNNETARLAIAKGHVEGRFGELSAPQTGVREIRSMAADEGNRFAQVILADLKYYGVGMTRDVSSALETLRRAATAGNDLAARRLVDLYRKGPARKDKIEAQRALSQYEKLFSPDVLAELRLLNLAALTQAVSDYEEVFELAKKQMGLNLVRVRDANANAYVYILQRQLAVAGEYSGEFNGLLTRSTISAFLNFCARVDIREECMKGPLSTSAIVAVSPQLLHL